MRDIVWRHGAEVVVRQRIARVSSSTGSAAQGKTFLSEFRVRAINSDLFLPLHFKKILTGSEGGDAEPHNDIPRYVRLVQAGKFNLDGLISHEYPLEKINEAIALVRAGEAGRVVVTMN